MPRAHGFIVDSIGSPIANADLYFYRVEPDSQLLHSVLIDKFDKPASGPPAYARRAIAEHREDLTIYKATTVADPARKGYFDVPGGLPAGSYWIDVHLGGQQRWAWPLVVTVNEQDPLRIRVGGPGVGPAPGTRLVLALFGDSDTSPQGPQGCRTTHLGKELTSSTIDAVNRAEGATPVHGWLPADDNSGKRNSGPEQVERACREMPRIDIAVFRFGLNDCHLPDMNPVTPGALAAIRDSYTRVIQAVRAKGALQVVLCQIIREGGGRSQTADDAFNGVVRSLATELGCALVSPDIDAKDDPEGYVWQDGIHLNDRGTRYVAGLIRDRIQQAPPAPGPVPGPTPTPDLAKQFTPGTFTAAASLYGLIAAPFEQAKSDMDRLVAAGFGHGRVWIDWDYFNVPGARALDRQGNWIEPQASKLSSLLDYGAVIGFSFDLTMHAAGYESEWLPGPKKYDITCHKRGLRNILMRFGKHPALKIVDVANEAEARGDGGHGSPDDGHVSPGRFKELMDVARSVPHTCLVGVSISPGGAENDVTKNYDAIFRDTKCDVLLPHFDRKAGFGAKEGPQGAALSAHFKGLRVHHQEPARNGHSTQPGMWPVSEYEAMFRTTKASGALGCCLHTDAGFDPLKGSWFDQLDSVERDVVARLKSWIA